MWRSTCDARCMTRAWADARARGRGAAWSYAGQCRMLRTIARIAPSHHRTRASQLRSARCTTTGRRASCLHERSRQRRQHLCGCAGGVARDCRHSAVRGAGGGNAGLVAWGGVGRPDAGQARRSAPWAAVLCAEQPGAWADMRVVCACPRVRAGRVAACGPARPVPASPGSTCRRCARRPGCGSARVRGPPRPRPRQGTHPRRSEVRQPLLGSGRRPPRPPRPHSHRSRAQ